MDTDLALTILFSGLVIVSALAWDRGCQCGKCGFHINERNVARIAREEEYRKARERAAERHHDFEHQGAIPGRNNPDRFNCKDATCPRNQPPKD